MMNQESFEGEPQEPGSETEQSRPNIIIDFIRHGETEYGSEIQDEMEKMGYRFEDVTPSSKISGETLEERQALEGRLTENGRQQLKEASQILFSEIDPDRETVLILFSPRTRTTESAQIVLESLKEKGIDISLARAQKKLIDFKEKHWLAVVEAASQQPDRTIHPFAYWYQMPEQKLKEFNLEGPKDIEQRTNSFVTLIQRFASRYKGRLELDRKGLRVIAITHDLAISSLSARDPEKKLRTDQVKNAQILELSIDRRGRESINLK